MENVKQESNKGNKIFYIILALLLVASIGMTFYKIVILKDYQIVSQTSCNPAAEKCFVSECDPATDDTCSTISSVTYYRKINKNAETIYNCENTAEKLGCGDELSCTSGEKNCAYTYCDPTKLLADEKCSE